MVSVSIIEMNMLTGDIDIDCDVVDVEAENEASVRSILEKKYNNRGEYISSQLENMSILGIYSEND